MNFKDEIATNQNSFRIVHADGTEEVVQVYRNANVTQAGTPLNATNLNAIAQDLLKEVNTWNAANVFNSLVSFKNVIRIADISQTKVADRTRLATLEDVENVEPTLHPYVTENSTNGIQFKDLSTYILYSVNYFSITYMIGVNPTSIGRCRFVFATRMNGYVQMVIMHEDKTIEFKGTSSDSLYNFPKDVFVLKLK